MTDAVVGPSKPPEASRPRSCHSSSLFVPRTEPTTAVRRQVRGVEADGAAAALASPSSVAVALLSAFPQ